ncbi:MAG: ABC transporter substrate-binding protein [Proteobacteria bacterium]|nr:ABC transporter substrate-binding protein [Pseudomonadota bacterium]
MRRIIPGILALLLLVLACPAISAEWESIPNTPTLHNGKKWRVGYLEGGPFRNYPLVLKSTISGLMSMGWVEPQDFPTIDDPEDTIQLWKWLSKNVHSNYIEFVEDGHWTSNWDQGQYKSVGDAVIKRLAQGKDLDLMIAMGTKAGQMLANDQHKVATIVLSSTDPLSAGIVKSVEDSGYDHVHARLDPERHKRQIRLFHDMFSFKRLGISYENTLEGRSYAAVEDVEAVAAERGFEVIPCFSPNDVQENSIAYKGLARCMEMMAPRVDAVYLTIHTGMDIVNLPNVMGPLDKYKVPTFSQGSSEEVEHGVLLSISQAGFKHVGRFHAMTMAKIFNGAKPRSLDQVFEDPMRIAINLAEAQAIGYDPPIDILTAADAIYQEIKQPVVEPVQ